MLYNAGRRVLRVRGLTWFAIAVALWATWGGAGIARTYGSRPADGGVLKPLPVRLALGGGVAFLGIAFAAAMIVYGRCYVARLDQERNGRLRVRTLGLFGEYEEHFPPSAISASRYHDGKLWTPHISVDAPWTTLWVSGRRLPLIVDAQGWTARTGLPQARRR